MTLVHIHTDRDIAARLIDEDRRTWIDVMEVTSQPIFKVLRNGRVISYEDGNDGVRAIDLPLSNQIALFHPYQPAPSVPTGLRFTFDSERAAMDFRLTHADHILDREPPNAARSVLMSLEEA